MARSAHHLLLLSLALFAAPGTAQLYVGASAGRVDMKSNRSDWSAAGVNTTYDDRGTAWRVFGGYNLNPNFGLEIGYASLGEYTADVSIPAVDSGRATVEVTSWQFLLTGKAPIGTQFALQGKLGLARNESKMRFSGGGVPGGFLASDQASKSKTALAWGVGASYALTKSTALRLDYESFGRSGESTNNFTIPGRTSESEPRLVSVGVQVGF